MPNVKVHTCISQEMVAQGLEEPPARKCKCRQLMPYQEADQRVKNGEARWCVVKRDRGEHEIICPLCKGDKSVANCAQCENIGKVVESVVWDTYSSDIVFVSQGAADPKEKKYRPALAMKTPRVATIESEHIELAYVIGNKEAQERIEEYGRLVLDARAFIGPNRIPAIKPEPADNPRTGEGRLYDYGRAV